MSESGKEFERLQQLVVRLRAEDGCPWDREQTPATIKRYLLEEVYELVDAVEYHTPDHIAGELGDLMFMAIFLAHQHLGQLSKGGGDLINSVANNTGTKVVFRAEAADAPTFLKWPPELKAIEDLTTLANYRCYVRPLVKGSPQPVCTLYTYADPPIPDPAEELRGERRGEPDLVN